jgi:uncharacterized radical SAM protein YgiQ
MKHCLPISQDEVFKRGWDRVDIVLITGDAYVDHPSFGTAVIGRVLENAGFRVAVLSQPDWHSKKDFQKFGRPSLFFGVSAGNMDSLVNKYTSLKKVRNSDAYSEGNTPFKKPDRAAIVYSQRAREAYKDVPVILGGIEASLRRFAHYDYWSGRVRRSILLDSKADLMVYGMGENQILEIAERLQEGKAIESIRDVLGTVYLTKEHDFSNKDGISNDDILKKDEFFNDRASIVIPSFEEVASDKSKFNTATRIIHEETNPFNAKTIIQYHGKRRVVQTPPPLPLTSAELDRIYELPFTRKPHPTYRGPVPAYEMIKNSVTIMRGCFGGCSFCSIAIHQGKIVQSRSEKSILKEIKEIAKNENAGAVISDIGGPTANMYRMGCVNRKTLSKCRKLSCVYPSICGNLNTDITPLLLLMKKGRELENVKHLFVSSGIRMDLALQNPEYIRQIAEHHVSGYIKVAPEHISRAVLRVMKKPDKEVYEKFKNMFLFFSKKAKKEQYVIPYLISSHPGAKIENELELALYLKKQGIRPRQIQDFLPSPMDIATSIYHTGHDPYSGEKVYTAKKESEKRAHRAIIQYYKKENRPLIIKALKKINKENIAGKLFR